MDDLIAFIKARLDEDETVARAATPGPWERPLDVRNKAIVMAALPADEQPRSYIDGIIPESFASHHGPTGRYAGQRERVSVVMCNTWSDGSHDRKRNGRDLEHIARHDPARVLREVTAKRTLVDGLARWPWALREIAAVYSDHPDYRQEWAP